MFIISSLNTVRRLFTISSTWSFSARSLSLPGWLSSTFTIRGNYRPFPLFYFFTILGDPFLCLLFFFLCVHPCFSTFVPSFGPYLRWFCKLCSKSINNFLNVNFQLNKLYRICSLALIGNVFVFRNVCDSYFTSSSCRFTVPSISVSCPFLDEALRLFPALMCLLSLLSLVLSKPFGDQFHEKYNWQFQWTSCGMLFESSKLTASALSSTLCFESEFVKIPDICKLSSINIFQPPLSLPFIICHF